MSTYYRYAERDVENQINWAEIGKNVTDMISTEVELREKKKAEIDSATNQYADVLANQPIGQNQAYNKFIVNFTDNASEARLMQDRLLRSGQLKLKDYNLMRQNLSQGTDQFFQIAKEYNTAYEEKIKRLENGDSSLLEQFIMEQAESFGNFANHELYINPTDFGVSLGKKVEKDGMMVLSEDPNDFVQLGELRMMVNQQVDKFDVNTAVADVVDNLAKKYKITYGPLKSRDDLRLMEGYDKFKEGYINALLDNPFDAASVLTDTVGMDKNNLPFKLTRNPAEQDENTILVKTGEGGRFIPELTESQRKIAREYLDGVFESMIGREDFEKEAPYRGRSSNQARADKKKENVNKMNLLMQVFDPSLAGSTTMSDNEVREKALLSISEGKFDTFTFEPIMEADGETETGAYEVYGSRTGEARKKIAEMNPNDPTGMRSWLEAAGPNLLGISDIKTVMQESQYNPDSQYSIGSSPESRVVINIEREEDRRKNKEAIDWYRSNLNQIITDDIDSYEDDDVAKIVQMYHDSPNKPAGFTFDHVESFGADYLEIKYDGNTIFKKQLDDPLPGLAQSIRDVMWKAVRSGANWQLGVMQEYEDSGVQDEPGEGGIPEEQAP